MLVQPSSLTGGQVTSGGAPKTTIGKDVLPMEVGPTFAKPLRTSCDPKHLKALALIVALITKKLIDYPAKIYYAMLPITNKIK